MASIQLKIGPGGSVYEQSGVTQLRVPDGQGGLSSFYFDAGIGGKFQDLISRSVTEITEDDLAGVTEIGRGAFYCCTQLISAALPEGVTLIPAEAFKLCSALQLVDLPSTVTRINGKAFESTVSMQSLIVRAETPPTLVTTSLENLGPNTTIYVPAASVSAYRAAPLWSGFASQIQAIPS